MTAGLPRALPPVRIATLAALLVLPGVPLGASVAERMRSAGDQLEAVQGRLERAITEKDAAEERVEAFHAELAAVETRIGELSRTIRSLRDSLKRDEGAMERLHRQERQQEALLADERKALAALVRATFTLGVQDRLRLLLNQQDPAMVSRILVYYDYLNQARLQRVRSTEEGLKSLHATREDIGLVRRRIEEEAAQAEQERRRMEEARAERQVLLTQLEATLRDKARQVRDLEADSRRIEALLARLGPEATPSVGPNRPRPFRDRKGLLAWPASGAPAAGFGERKASGVRWDGLLLEVPEGAEVRAVHGGEVVFAEWLRGYGLLLIIDHGEGYLSLYGHNQSLLRKAGDRVEAGDVVALAGVSGGQEQAGLYFGIRYQGRPVDPKAWCVPVPAGRAGEGAAPAALQTPG